MSTELTNKETGDRMTRKQTVYVCLGMLVLFTDVALPTRWIIDNLLAPPYYVSHPAVCTDISTLISTNQVPDLEGGIADYSLTFKNGTVIKASKFPQNPDSVYMGGLDWDHIKIGQDYCLRWQRK